MKLPVVVHYDLMLVPLGIYAPIIRVFNATSHILPNLIIEITANSGPTTSVVSYRKARL